MADDTYITNSTTAYKLSGFFSTILATFSTPGTSAVGLAFDGTNFYTADNATKTVYKHNGFSANILTTFSFPSGHTTCYNLAWDGGKLLFSSNAAVCRLSSTGLVTSQVAALGYMSWRAAGLLSFAVEAQNKVYGYPGFSATWNTFLTFGANPGVLNTVGGAIRALGWDGSNLLVGLYDSKIFRLSGFSTTISTVIQPIGIGIPTGITTGYDFNPDSFTVNLAYQDSGGVFQAVTTPRGNYGANVKPGSRTVYWGNPGDDRGVIEPVDETPNAVIKLTATASVGNVGTYTLIINSAIQMSAADAVGSVGDVKISYSLL